MSSDEHGSIDCHVFKSLAKRDVYVYLAERDGARHLPEALRDLLGELELVVSFELTAERKLARESAADVLANIRSKGYHLQMPDTNAPSRRTAH